ncbi:hypothetical protein HQN84_20765 [Pedobacter steynii]|nr:hypothetical protein [Pedobacter steynii]NQX41295.1 hypothetical protein [Pedobacter steynii]
MSLKVMYYYLFYKFYKLFEAFKTTRWLTDTKAIIVVMSIEIWILFSLNCYYDVLSHKRGQLNFISIKVLVPFILLLIIKWFAFWRDDRWKDYVKEFDKWPEEKNNKGGWIVAGITLFFFANLLFSLYLDPPPGGWKQ